MSLHTTSAPLAASATRLAVDSADRGGSDRGASPGVFAGLLQEQKLTAQPNSQALLTSAGAVVPAQGFRPTLAPPPMATAAQAARLNDAGAAEARRTERATVEAHADSHRSADARTEAHRAQARRTAAADAQRQLQGARAAAGPHRSARTDLAASDDVGATKGAAHRAGDKAGKDADHQVAANARHEGSGSPVDPPVSSAPGSESSRQGDAAGDAGSTSGQGAGDNNGNGSSKGNGDGNDHGSRAELAGVDAGATQGGAASAAGRMSTDRDVTGDAGPAPAFTAATRGGAAHAGSAAAVARSTSAAIDTSSDAATLASNNASTAAALRGDGGGGVAAGVSPHGSGTEARRVASAGAETISSSTGGGDAASSFASALAGATAAAGQSAAATPQSAAGVTAQVPVPVDAPEFGATVMMQVGRFAAGGIEQATLNLNPAELGPIQIHITLDGRQASVDFGAAHGHTRDLLQAAMSDLAAALQGDGLTLAAARVADLPTQVDRSGASPWSSPAAESQGSATAAGADAGQGGRANGGQPDNPGNRQGGAQVPGSTPMGGERTQRLTGLGWGQPDAPAGGPHAGASRLGLDLYA